MGTGSRERAVLSMATRGIFSAATWLFVQLMRRRALPGPDFPPRQGCTDQMPRQLRTVCAARVSSRDGGSWNRVRPRISEGAVQPRHLILSISRHPSGDIRFPRYLGMYILCALRAYLVQTTKARARLSPIRPPVRLADPARRAMAQEQQLPSLPPVRGLRSRPDPAQTAVLDLLFEPSSTIHSTLLPVLQAAEYSSYPELIDACHGRLRSLASSRSASDSAPPTLLSVLGSHPRLGEKKVDSAQSVAEQANLRGEGQELAALNREYEIRFPGLRYVVFVNGRARPEIMRDMRARIERNEFATEVDAALQVGRASPPLAR
ncbi:unnamed protein product [Ilex paraguariensis]|uniref:Oxo-4-hydroxy-4-carboxy-5-ureidoimidazoline decarboxylase domain-containing protein n=1 Tax=Ilex paraguariensis TaxID=185542 RepID=A0ABC8QMK7_9AQUA